eukprot:415555-Rhodomonas_salina.2
MEGWFLRGKRGRSSGMEGGRVSRRVPVMMLNARPSAARPEASLHPFTHRPPDQCCARVGGLGPGV